MAARRVRALGSRSAATREAILSSALEVFGARGFEGASMNEIASRAEVHTPLLSYHFGDKRGLWEAAVTSVIAELDERLVGAWNADDPKDALRELIRSFVEFAAAHPEVNRIVAWESASGSDRLDWLVETHTRRRFDALAEILEPLQKAGVVKPIPAISFYYLLIGGASLPFVAAHEARAFSQCEPTDPDFIAAHTAALESVLLVAV